MGNKAIPTNQPTYSVWSLHLNANSIMGFDLLIKVGKTLVFNKSNPRELLSVRCVEAASVYSHSLCVCVSVYTVLYEL